MRLLYAHADRAAVDAADGATAELTDCVAAFVAVEPGDAAAPEAVATSAADELRTVADRLGVDGVVLYRCPHLLDAAAAEGPAATAVDALAERLPADYDVRRARVEGDAGGAVDWRGHPLAVGGCRVGPAADSLQAADDRAVVTPSGDRRDPGTADGTLRAVADAGRPSTDPPGDDRLRELGFLAEDGATWLPRGAFVRDALAARADDLLAEAGAVRVAAADSHEGRGPAASVPADIADADLPVRLRDPGGWRGADAPEMAVVVADATAGADEFRRAAAIAREAVGDLGVDAAPVVRTVAGGADAGPSSAAVAAAVDAPVLAETLPMRVGRWSTALDFVAVVDGRAVRTGAVRYDPPRSDSADGGPSRPTVRCAPVGRLDVAIRATVAGDGGLPTWLAPTQVRLVPVDAGHAERCDAVVAALSESGVRADVDDRELSVGDRIGRAEAAGVPYYAVVGEREAGDGPLPVTERASGRESAMTVAELAETVREATAAYPSRRRPLPARLRDWPPVGGA
ncbi:His/Gly/Thr/Pro-type tRNA ligase C-terminal domain-containing protein [Halostella salina]|uniref:His/Gly/Thr/Pro-type tRNA ligase C-terminal domain-containing protein n=1 Tax=Halostella salina TaxID=1547897 RepID=UPI000EF7B310|nr:His/Gly/Thr/Pro-type tRNA ligase C-terminal domain-containing protein [Halostella salina]